jgi:ribosomal protein L24E
MHPQTKNYIYLTCTKQCITRIKLGRNEKMVSEGRGRLFRRKDGNYLIYLPKDLAEDSMFPFKGASSIFVKIGFKLGGKSMLVEEWVEPEQPEQ